MKAARVWNAQPVSSLRGDVFIDVFCENVALLRGSCVFSSSGTQLGCFRRGVPRAR